MESVDREHHARLLHEVEDRVSTRRRRARLLAIATLASAAAVAVVVASAFPEGREERLVPLVGATAALLFGTYAAFMLWTLRTTPRSLQVAILGTQGAGKTTFLAALAHELIGTPLQVGNISGLELSLQPNEVGNLQSLLRTMNSLVEDGFPSPSEMLVVRGTLAYKRGFAAHTFSLELVEVGEGAGEAWTDARDLQKGLQALDPIRNADGYLWLLDGLSLVDEGRGVEPEVVLDGMLWALDASAGYYRRPTWQPLGIVVTKADLLERDGGSEGGAFRWLEPRMEHIVMRCSTRFSEVRVFFVSLLPQAVVERNVHQEVIGPLLWVVEEALQRR